MNATPVDYAKPIHFGRHSPGGADDIFGGVRLAPYPLTLSAATSINDTATSVHERFPIKVPARTRRWRLHLRNYNDRQSTAYAGALSVGGIYFGQHALAADGSLTGNFAAAPTQLASAFTTDAAGGEWISPWVNVDAQQFSRGVEYLLSLGYTCAAQTNHCGIGGGWRSTHPEDIASATPANALSTAQTMPLDIWLECEISAQVPILGHLGDSLLCGTNSTVPIRDGYAMKHAHMHGIWPMILANHGSAMTDWTTTSQWKWQKYAGLAKPDAILSEIGSNDIFALSASLATAQASFATYVAALRSFWGTVPLYLRSILPRNGSNTDATRDGVRQAFNAWLYTLPANAHGVFPFDECVLDPATASSTPQNVLAAYISSDGVHLNSAGYARTAVVMGSPIAVTHVRPAPALVTIDTTPPAVATGFAVTNPTGTGAGRSALLAWTNPSDSDFYGVIIRRTLGNVAPTSPTQAGTAITSTGPGVASFTDTGLSPTTQYSWSIFTRDRLGNINTTPVSYTLTTAADTTAPGPVTSVIADADGTKVKLAWTNPTDTDFADVIIRRAAGATPPATSTSGTAVTTTTDATVVTYTDTGLTANTQYSYSLFAVDASGNAATAATATVTTLSAVVTGYTARFSASSISGGAGTSVPSWRSSEGTGFTLTPVITSATAPQVAVDTTQTTPVKCVLFDGVNNSLGHLTALPRTQPYTVAVVFRAVGPVTGSTGVKVIAGGISGTGGRGTLYWDASAGRVLYNAGSSINGPTLDNNWHVAIASVNGASTVVRLDGTEVTGNAGAEAATIFNLGNYQGSSAAANVEIAEVILYPSALNSTDRASLQTALKTTYSVLP